MLRLSCNQCSRNYLQFVFSTVTHSFLLLLLQWLNKLLLLLLSLSPSLSSFRIATARIFFSAASSNNDSVVVRIFLGDGVSQERWKWGSSEFVPEMRIEKVGCRGERLVRMGRWDKDWDGDGFGFGWFWQASWKSDRVRRRWGQADLTAMKMEFAGDGGRA